jgi:disulfide bond formation protein DsbB
MSSLSTPRRLPPRNAAAFAAGAAALLLLAVFAMQYLGGLAPCELCLWQRWPHGAVILFGGLALLPAASDSGRRVLLGLCALSFATTAGIGFYHAGVEYGLFAGPTACSGAITGGTIEELRQQLTAAPVVRCDEAPWSLLGISLAGYNVLVSGALAAFCAVAALWSRIVKQG